MKFAVIVICFFAIIGSLLATAQDDALNQVRNYYKKLEEKHALQNSVICNECKTTITDLKSALTDNKKLNKLKDVIKMACNFFSGGQQYEECKKTVDLLGTYAHKLTSILDRPEYACEQMLLCKPDDDGEHPIGNRVLITSLKAFLRSTSVGTATEFETHQCDECVLVINTLYAILADGGVQKVLKYLATEICTVIPGLTVDCDPYMDHYFPVAMNKIETYLSDPIQVCKTFFVCRSKMSFMETIHHKVPLKRVLPLRHQHLHSALYALPQLRTKSGDDAGCVACTATITTIVALLNQPKILDGVTKGLTIAVCEKILPANITESCEDFFNHYLKAVIFMTVNQLTPDAICTKLHACTNASSIHSFLSLNARDQSSTACEACQTVTNFLTNEFQQPTFQQDVLSFVKSLVCAREKSTEAQCSSMVDEYIPYVMQVICDYLSRNTLCHLLHLCPAN